VTNDATPVRVGLVGAGQWASEMHAPLHASAGPTSLAGVWSRDPDRAESLADHFGVRAFRDLAALFKEVDAIDFAVPPAVQAKIAVRAADAGLSLMLEKPLAADLHGARELNRAVCLNDVATIVAMTRRYDPTVDAFIHAAAALQDSLVGITAMFVHGGLLPRGFIGADERSGWRVQLGVLADLGPHLIDVVDAVSGSVVTVQAEESPGEAVALTMRHEGGALSQLMLSSRVGAPAPVFFVQLLGHGGGLRLEDQPVDVARVRARMRQEFADAVRSRAAVTVDARRAFHVQCVVEAAVDSLRERGTTRRIAY
jgi:predicted dehydrogenase